VQVRSTRVAHFQLVTVDGDALGAPIRTFPAGFQVDRTTRKRRTRAEEASVPRSPLIDAENANDLGAFMANTTQWKSGDRIRRSSEGDLIVLRLVEADADDKIDGYLVVEPAP